MTERPDPGHMIRLCHEILPRMFVEACGVETSDANRAAEDVLLRAEAAARLNRASCEILAAPFFEESFFHDPDEASAWMKAITTLVIRNSQLEELQLMDRSALVASRQSLRMGWGRSPSSSQPGDATLQGTIQVKTLLSGCLWHTRVLGLAWMHCGPRLTLEAAALATCFPKRPVPNCQTLPRSQKRKRRTILKCPPTLSKGSSSAGSIPGSIRTLFNC